MLVAVFGRVFVSPASNFALGRPYGAYGRLFSIVLHGRGRISLEMLARGSRPIGYYPGSGSTVPGRPTEESPLPAPARARSRPRGDPEFLILRTLKASGSWQATRVLEFFICAGAPVLLLAWCLSVCQKAMPSLRTEAPCRPPSCGARMHLVFAAYHSEPQNQSATALGAFLLCHRARVSDHEANKR